MKIFFYTLFYVALACCLEVESVQAACAAKVTITGKKQACPGDEIQLEGFDGSDVSLTGRTFTWLVEEDTEGMVETETPIPLGEYSKFIITLKNEPPNDCPASIKVKLVLTGTPPSGTACGANPQAVSATKTHTIAISCSEDNSSSSQSNVSASSCNGCGGGVGSNSAIAGSASISNNEGPTVTFSMGPYDDESDSLYFGFSAKNTTSLVDPSRLLYPFDLTDVKVKRNQDGSINQIGAPTAVAIITDVVSNSSYKIKFYDKADVTEDSNCDCYVPNMGVNPFVTWILSDPSGPVNLKIAEERGGQEIRHFEFTEDSTIWSLKDSGDLRVFKSWKSNSNGFTYYHDQILQGTEIVHQVVKKYETIDGDLALLQIIEGFDETKTTIFENYPTNTNGAGEPKRIDYPDGRWEMFEYDSNHRVVTKYESYLDLAPPTGSNFPSDYQSKKTVYIYEDPQTLLGFFTPKDEIVYVPYLGTWKIESYLRRVVQYSYGTRDYESDEFYFANPQDISNSPIVRFQPKITMAVANLVEDIDRNRLKYLQHPDQTISVFSYLSDQNGTAVIESRGEEVSSTVWLVKNGTKTTKEYDLLGRLETVKITRIVNGTEQTNQVLEHIGYLYTGNGPEYTLTNYLAATSTIYNYDCCGISDITHPDGNVTRYQYDDLRRPYLESMEYGSPSEGVSVTKTYDAAGRVLMTQRTPLAGGSSVVQQQWQYDDLGRLTAQTNYLSSTLFGKTTYNYDDVGGREASTETRPDGGTVIQTYYQDGRLYERKGTATHPVRFEYGIGEVTLNSTTYWWRWEKEIKLDKFGNPTSEWTQTYYDNAGRPAMTSYAHPSTSTSPFSMTYYNDKGQVSKTVDPDGVVNLFAYDNEGRLKNTATDLYVQTAPNDGIDFAGRDRVQETAYGFLTYSGVPVVTETHYQYKALNSTTLTMVGQTYRAPSGLHQWTFVPGRNNPTHQQISFGANGYRTNTLTNPDLTQVIQVYRYGRLLETVQKDSAGGQMGKTTYQYDSHGRQYRVIDARNGTTTYTFNDADGVTKVTFPAATYGATPQETLTVYNNMGQVIQEYRSDGTSVENEYHPTGLLKKTWGSQTYPVEYTYDAQGRMDEMKTWKDYADGNGADTTTSWVYDAYRGWLKKKIYEGEMDDTDDYTYTNGGRLKTRSWERGVTTTYSYGFDDAVSDNNHSDLVNIDYSDSTPDVIYTLNRSGEISLISQNGINTTQTYNDAGLMLSESYSGGFLSTYSVVRSYHSAGSNHALKLSKIEAKAGASAMFDVDYSYGTHGRLSEVDDGGKKAIFGYESNSPLVESIEFKNGSTTRMTTTKTYDYLNRLTSIANQAGATLPVSYNYTYNTANQRTRMAFSDGSYWVYTYDAMGQVTSGKRYWSDGQPVAGQQFEYGFDDIGNRTYSKDGGDANGQNLRETTYTSNAWNQYTNRVNPGFLNVLGVANVGAAVTVNSLATTRRGEYFHKELAVANTQEQYVSITVDSDQTPPEPTGKRYVPKEDETLIYDEDGNLLSDGRWTYTWDAENRLIKLERDAGPGNALSQKLEFDYDSSGRRIRKRFYTKPSTDWAPQSDQVYLYDGWNLVATATPNTGGSTGWAQGYVWGTDLSGTMTGAGGVGGLLMVHYNSSGGTQFVGMDGNGNVVGTCATDGNGWTSRYEYGPFGETIRGSGVLAKSNPFRFSTKFTDNESGLVYYGYRYYSEELGRWLNRDPIQEKGGINLFVAVNNDTVNKIDILGLGNEDDGLLVKFILKSLVGFGSWLRDPYSTPKFSWSPQICDDKYETIFVQVYRNIKQQLPQGEVDDGDDGWFSPPPKHGPEFPINDGGRYEDSPGGELLGATEFVVCRACLETCCGNKKRLIMLGPCKYFRHDEKRPTEDGVPAIDTSIELGQRKDVDPPTWFTKALNDLYPNFLARKCY